MDSRVQVLALLAALAMPVVLGILTTVATVVSHQRRRTLFLKEFGVWLSAFLPLLVVVAVRDFKELTTWLPLLLVAGGLGRISWKRLKSKSIVVVVGILIATFALERMSYERTFAPLGAEIGGITRIGGLLSGVQTLVGGVASPQLWLRKWQLPRVSTAPKGEFAADVRVVTGHDVRTWYVKDADLIETVHGTSAKFLAEDARLWRTFTSPDKLGGRSFRLSGVLTSGAPQKTDECEAVVLRVDSRPWINSCRRASFGDSGEFKIEWTVPNDVEENVLRVELNSAGQVRSERTVKDVVLEEISAAQVSAVDEIVPQYPLLSLMLTANEEDKNGIVTTVLKDTNEWTTVVLPLPELAPPASGEPWRVEASLRIPSGMAIEIRNSRFFGAAKSLALPQRQAGWFGHPNVAGIITALLVLVLFASNGPLSLKIIGILGLCGAMLFSDSRVGFILLVCACLPFITAVVKDMRTSVPRVANKYRIIMNSISILSVVGLLLIVLQFGRWDGLEDGNSRTRFAIWEAAGSIFLAKPVFGWGGAAQAMLNERLGSGAYVSHAHNWFLEQGLRYGIIGLGAVCWLLIQVTCLMRRRRAWTALYSWILLLLANTFDNTLMAPVSWAIIAILVGVSKDGVALRAKEGPDSGDR